MNIKLRGFDKKEDVLADAMFDHDQLMMTRYCNPNDNIFNDDDMEIMLWTTRYDKHKVEIYDGDIVKVPAGFSGDHYYKECIAVVYWDCYQFELFNPHSDYNMVYQDWHWNELAVIGNKYQNQELLQKEEKKIEADFQI